VIGSEIYAIDEADGAETYRLVNPNVDGLTFLGSSSSEACWLSLRNKIAIDVTAQFENKNKLLRRSSEGYEYQMHLSEADNGLSVIDGDEGLVFQNTGEGDPFYFSIHEKPAYAEIIEHRMSGDTYKGYKHNPFRLKTSFPGQGPAALIRADKFVIVFYKSVLYGVANRALEGAAEKAALVKVRGFTFDQGKFFENPSETVRLPPPSQWGAGSLVYEYPLRYNTGASFSLDIYSEGVISVISVAIDARPESNPAPGTVRNVARQAAGG
jgi:hypothetical protein